MTDKQIEERWGDEKKIPLFRGAWIRIPDPDH
jgi:hypothetical protein